MFNKYYQQELENLRELAREFAKKHPAIAPMLSGPTSDPDVERLLEGSAFLTGLLREKIDDEFPEIIHSLLDVTLPHYLRTIPSVSLVEFKPNKNQMGPVKVSAGTELASIPVGETKCIFKTCSDMEVQPLYLLSADFERQRGKNPRIILNFRLKNIDLSKWKATKIRFFMGGNYTNACDIFMILSLFVSKIIIRSGEKSEECYLPLSSLKQIGFDPRNVIIPYEDNTFSAYRLLQEYFILPRKFLLMELGNIDKWVTREHESEFSIIFELKSLPKKIPRISADIFQLHVVPVINIFKFDADPIHQQHKLDKLRITLTSGNKEYMQIYSVDEVTGLVQGSAEKKNYKPFKAFSEDNDNNIYQVHYSNSPVDNSPEFFLSFIYSQDKNALEPEILMLKLSCSNGKITEKLQVGDICKQTATSPDSLTFKNIIPPSIPLDPPLGKKALWYFLSHLSLNYLSIADLNNIKKLLNLYICPNDRDKVRRLANEKRVEGILNLEVENINRLVDGFLMKGRRITMTLNRDNFAGMGDLYLFGSVLNHFFSVYSAINSFIQLEIKEKITGETFSWPMMLGNRPLI